MAGKFNIPGSNESVDKNELRWSVFKHKPADEMLMHVRMKVFPFLEEFNKSSNPEYSDSDNFTLHMANAVFIMPKTSLQVSAINIRIPSAIHILPLGNNPHSLAAKLDL